jgi:RNA polymerase-binding transcription factor DksA
MIAGRAERLNLVDVSRRLEEEYDRHMKLLSNLKARVVRGAEELIVVQQVASRSRRSITEIARARQAIAEGRYGVCGRCAHRISTERLKVLPHATHCVRCAEWAGNDELVEPDPARSTVHQRLTDRATAHRGDPLRATPRAS